jgi:hypothetical protein
MVDYHILSDQFLETRLTDNIGLGVRENIINELIKNQHIGVKEFWDIGLDNGFNHDFFLVLFGEFSDQLTGERQDLLQGTHTKIVVHLFG